MFANNIAIIEYPKFKPFQLKIISFMASDIEVWSKSKWKKKRRREKNN